MRVPWPGGSGARGGGGAVRLSSVSLLVVWGCGGLEATGCTGATGGAELTLETLIALSLLSLFPAGPWACVTKDR